MLVVESRKTSSAAARTSGGTEAGAVGTEVGSGVAEAIRAARRAAAAARRTRGSGVDWTSSWSEVGRGWVEAGGPVGVKVSGKGSGFGKVLMVVVGSSGRGDTALACIASSVCLFRAA